MSRKSFALYDYDPIEGTSKAVGVFDGRAILGSSDTADCWVDDPKASGLHALIEFEESGQFRLVDLGSKFGTYVDGSQTQEVALVDAQQFKIGTHSYFAKPSLRKEVSDLEIPVPKSKGTKDLEKSGALITENDVLEVSLLWGEKLLEVRTFEPGAKITLGTHRSATFAVTMSHQDLTDKPQEIARYEEGQLILHVPAEANGLIWTEKESHAIDTLRHKDESKDEFGAIDIKLRIGDRAFIQFNELGLSFRFVSPAEKLKRSIIPKLDPTVMKTTVGIVVAYLLIFALFSLVKIEEKEKTLDDIPDHLKQVLYDAGIEEALKKQQSAIGQIAQALGGRARSEEGKASQKKTPQKKTEQKKSTQPKQQVTQEQAPAAPSVDLDAAFATKSETNAPEHVDITGATQDGNAATAIADGGFARGTKGLGSGGGGESVGIGQLKGSGVGGGMGAGDYGLAPSKGREIRVPDEEEVVVLGGLDPDVISAIIRRYLAQIQNCYEQQRAVKPNLRGKVTVAFMIGPTGSVKKPSIAETSLRDPATEACILERVATWQFPKPRGGGTVGVKYPFLLMSNTGQ